MIYLASPYSHPDPEIERQRAEAATTAAAWLVSQGKLVFSPMALSHPMHLEMQRHGRTLSHREWLDFDTPFLEMCDELLVLKLEGWVASRGIAWEVNYALAHMMPVHYIGLEDIPWLRGCADE